VHKDNISEMRNWEGTVSNVLQLASDTSNSNPVNKGNGKEC
jgi:hypothetical protein